jgi:hypothetical protein
MRLTTTAASHTTRAGFGDWASVTLPCWSRTHHWSERARGRGDRLSRYDGCDTGHSNQAEREPLYAGVTNASLVLDGWWAFCLIMRRGPKET